MSIKPRLPPQPRDKLKCLRPHKGLMCFVPEEDGYDKFPVIVGNPSPAGFVPIEKTVGVVRLGVIYLKNQGPVRSGYYAVYPRDLYRRRIDARPSRRLTIEQATLIIGGSLSHLGITESDEAISAAIESGPLEVTAREELGDADVCFQEQVRALHSSQDSEEDWFM